MTQEAKQATVLEIVRMSTEDGPGIRTTVFFKGCSLHCAWCHNPESISAKPQLCWFASRCIGCRTCEDICPNDALTIDDTGVHIDRNRCEACGTCAAECPGTALELLGTRWELDALTTEVLKDRAYFETSGGGITASGGEPAMQSEFVGEFFRILRGHGIHTALDTCGYCAKTALDRILPYAAMVLFDIKVMDPERHRQYTGHDNQAILDNLLYIADFIRSHVHPSALWIRTPLIPGATADHDNIDRIARFIKAEIYDVVNRWELCAFNNLCRDKYLRLGRKWAYEDAELLAQAELDGYVSTASAAGISREKVFWTGSSKLMAS
jgi:pyruvate formate lyase activating enzyme